MSDRFSVMCSQLAGERLPSFTGEVLRTVRRLGAGAVGLDDLIAKVFEDDQEDAPARPARRTVFDRAGLIAPDIPKRTDRRRKAPATQAPARFRKAPALSSIQGCIVVAR